MAWDKVGFRNLLARLHGWNSALGERNRARPAANAIADALDSYQQGEALPGTTKGDVIVHDGSAHVRLPIGSDTQVLTADSTMASGVKWAAGGGASAFAIADLQPAVHLVGDDVGEADGVAIPTWFDSSENKLDAVQGTASLRPMADDSVANGHRGVKADGTDDYFPIYHAWDSYSPWTVILAFKTPTLDGTARGIMSWAAGLTSGAPGLIIQQNGSTNFRIYANGDYRLTTASASNTVYIFVIQYNKQYVHGYVNDPTFNHVAMTSSPYQALTLSNMGVSNQFWLFNGFAAYWGGHILEFAFVPRNITRTERTDVFTLLSDKYGV